MTSDRDRTAGQRFRLDPTNPGEALACLGALELAELLHGDAEGYFAGGGAHGETCFALQAAHAPHPFTDVLDFLAECEVEEYRPIRGILAYQGLDESDKLYPAVLSGHFQGRPLSIVVYSWVTFPGQSDFKFFSGQMAGVATLKKAVYGVAKEGIVGMRDLIRNHHDALLEAPFEHRVPLKSSFNLDVRKTWSAREAGYSPDDTDHLVLGSPLLDVLGLIGLAAARPQGEKREGAFIHYFLWSDPLPTLLARAAYSGDFKTPGMRGFRCTLGKSGKLFTFNVAEEISVAQPL